MLQLLTLLMPINAHASHTGFLNLLLYVSSIVGGYGAYGAYGGAGRFYPVAGGLKPAKPGAHHPVNSQQWLKCSQVITYNH